VIIARVIVKKQIMKHLLKKFCEMNLTLESLEEILAIVRLWKVSLIAKEFHTYKE
jgi:hypothetical protein